MVIVKPKSVILLLNQDYCFVLPSKGVVVFLHASEQKVWSSKLYRKIAGIRQKGHPELKMLRYCSRKSIRKRVRSGRHTVNQHV